MATVRAEETSGVRPGLLGIGSPRVPSDLVPEPPQGFSDWRALNTEERAKAAGPLARLSSWVAEKGELTWANRTVFTHAIARSIPRCLHVDIRIEDDGARVERRRGTP